MNRSLPTFDAAEERNKLSHFTVQGFNLHGIVQAGAHNGEEMENAMRMGVEHYIAFEPLKSAFEDLVETQHAAGDPYEDYWLVNIGLSHYDHVGLLNVSAGDGKGSSLLAVNKDHPEVQANWHDGQADFVRTEKVELKRFDSWYRELSYDIDLRHFDTLQLDTQGNELDILKGMGKFLDDFHYLCIELSETPIYDGEVAGYTVAEWLDKRGFLLDSPITAHNDTFFVRKDIKNSTDGQYKGRC